MVMTGNLGGEQRHRLNATQLADGIGRESRSLPGVDWHPTPQVWQGERGLTIAAVGRTQQGKESRVLRNAQNLAITQGPALRREIKTYHPDFT
jgi:hypothetical protein